jgi:P27 family predicted phage terminase small subunit
MRRSAALKAVQGRPETVPAPPDWLAEAAKDLWTRLAPELVAKKYLGPLDVEKFGAACQAYARWLDAERIVAAEGMTYTTPTGLQRPHPAVGIARDALKAFNSLGRRFGLSPLDRAGLPFVLRAERSSGWGGPGA